MQLPAEDLSRYLQIPDEELNAVEEETGRTSAGTPPIHRRSSLAEMFLPAKRPSAGSCNAPKDHVQNESVARAFGLRLEAAARRRLPRPEAPALLLLRRGPETTGESAEGDPGGWKSGAKALKVVEVGGRGGCMLPCQCQGETSSLLWEIQLIDSWLLNTVSPFGGGL